MVTVKKFSAAWCGPCRALTPKLSNMSNEFQNVTFVKLDVENENNIELVMNLNIMSVPTFVLLNDGAEVARMSGGTTTDKLKESLLEFLNSDTYTLAERSGSCIYCQFSNICKRENYL